MDSARRADKFRGATVEIVMATSHPWAECVDLRATFAGVFKFAYDESYAAESASFRNIEKAWLTTIPCKAGRIFPWGGRTLAAYCNTSAAKRRALEAVPGVTIVQGGSGCSETVVTFDVEGIEAVAGVLGAKRQRRLSDGQRAACSARLRQLAADRGGLQKPNVNGGCGAPETTIGRAADEWDVRTRKRA